MHVWFKTKLCSDGIMVGSERLHTWDNTKHKKTCWFQKTEIAVCVSCQTVRQTARYLFLGTLGDSCSKQLWRPLKAFLNLQLVSERQIKRGSLADKNLRETNLSVFQSARNKLKKREAEMRSEEKDKGKQRESLYWEAKWGKVNIFSWQREKERERKTAHG